MLKELKTEVRYITRNNINYKEYKVNDVVILRLPEDHQYKYANFVNFCNRYRYEVNKFTNMNVGIDDPAFKDPGEFLYFIRFARISRSTEDVNIPFISKIKPVLGGEHLYDTTNDLDFVDLEVELGDNGIYNEELSDIFDNVFPYLPTITIYYDDKFKTGYVLYLTPSQFDLYYTLPDDTIICSDTFIVNKHCVIRKSDINYISIYDDKKDISII